MADELLRLIADSYLEEERQRYAAVPHPRHIVLFSGVPGSGKSHLAQQLQQALQAWRIESDALRRLIAEADPALGKPEINELVITLCKQMLADDIAPAANGLVLFDASCDRRYDDYKQEADRLGFGLTVFRLTVPRSIVEQRLAARPDGAAYLRLLDRWWHDWETFGRRGLPAYTVTPSTSLDEVLAVLHAAGL